MYVSGRGEGSGETLLGSARAFCMGEVGASASSPHLLRIPLAYHLPWKPRMLLGQPRPKSVSCQDKNGTEFGRGAGAWWGLWNHGEHGVELG